MLGFLGLMGILASTVFAHPAKDRLFLQNATERFADEDAVKIVVLGDSRMWFALADDETLITALTEAAGRPVTVVTAYVTNGEFRGFRRIIPEVLNMDPDLVLVQTALPFKQKSRKGVINTNRDMLIDATFLGSAKSQTRIAALGSCNHLTINPDLEHSGDLDDIDTTYFATGPAYDEAAQLLAMADSSDATLLMVNAPQPRFGPLTLPDHPSFEPTVLPSTVVLPADHFCDPLHVTPEGSDAYTAAFIQSVADWLRAQDQGN